MVHNMCMLNLEDHTSTAQGVIAPGLVEASGPHILPGVPMGREDQLLTPAYWKWRCSVGEEEGHDYISRGGTLEDEVIFCILGGFGIKMEINDAFFRHLKAQGALSTESPASEGEILTLLWQAIDVDGRPHRYRFPQQRAYRIAKAIEFLRDWDPSGLTDLQFRDTLCTMPGVGPKTASWITRNWRGAETVAILDIHVMRAGWYLGIFELNSQLPRDYSKLEAKFLHFAEMLDVRPAVLDAVMWSDMRIFGSRLASKVLPH